MSFLENLKTSMAWVDLFISCVDFHIRWKVCPLLNTWKCIIQNKVVYADQHSSNSPLSWEREILSRLEILYLGIFSVEWFWNSPPPNFSLVLKFQIPWPYIWRGNKPPGICLLCPHCPWPLLSVPLLSLLTIMVMCDFVNLIISLCYPLRKEGNINYGWPQPTGLNGRERKWSPIWILTRAAPA